MVSSQAQRGSCFHEGNKMSDPIKIYPVQNVLTKLYVFFQEFCSECGCLHLYRKYKGWQKKHYITMCYKDLLKYEEWLDLCSKVVTVDRSLAIIYIFQKRNRRLFLTALP